jgi:hypothetical protein
VIRVMHDEMTEMHGWLVPAALMVEIQLVLRL